MKANLEDLSLKVDFLIYFFVQSIDINLLLCICRIEVSMFVEVNFDKNFFIEVTTSTIKFGYGS
jgi:hypothetical protein